MARGARRPRGVFLSHASADRPLADAVVRTLRAHGIAVWYSTTDLRGAQQWHDEIGRALQRSDWFVVLLSPAAVRSPWVKREVMYALSAVEFVDRIVPVMVRRCKLETLSWTLNSLQRVDCTRSFRAGCRDLL